MPQFKIIPNELFPGKFWNFPPIKLSEGEIFEFSRLCDPQKIHLDKIAAEKSIFGGLIASGLQPYVWFHEKYWISATEDHFICGISFEAINFFKPVYPNIPFKGRLSVTIQHSIVAIFVITRIAYCERSTIKAFLLQITQPSKAKFFIFNQKL